MTDKLPGTPWRPVPGRDSLRIPTNIKEDGRIIDETGNVEGHAEENENIEERFNPGIDPEEDENFRKKVEEEKEKQKEKKET